MEGEAGGVGRCTKKVIFYNGGFLDSYFINTGAIRKKHFPNNRRRPHHRPQVDVVPLAACVTLIDDRVHGRPEAFARVQAEILEIMEKQAS